jgi:hypothetical protein
MKPHTSSHAAERSSPDGGAAHNTTRREFLERTAAFAGTALLSAHLLAAAESPRVRTAVASDWPEVHLVRVNPQASHVDGPEERWNKSGDNIVPVVEQLQAMHAKGRGVIGMKLVGNGDFQNPADRERAVRFAMARPEIAAVVVGFKSAKEIDEAIQRIDRALAAG